MTICFHDENTWEETDDGETYCPDCDSAVCPNCGVLYEDLGLHRMDTLEPILELPCECDM